MNKPTTYLIRSLDDFHKYLPLLKKDSLINNKIHAIGLDAEYICKANHPISFSNSHKWVENPSNTVVCTIQMASPTICFVINLVNMGLPFPNKLSKILVSDGWLKFGVGIDNDLRILSQNYNLGYCGGVIDLKSLALVSKHSNPNLECLYNQFLGEGIKKSNKSSGRTDWGAGELTNEQIEYAAKDAIMSYKLGLKMMEPLLQKSSSIEINVENVVNTSPIISELCSKSNEIFTILKPAVFESVNYVGRLNEIAQQLYVPTPDYSFITKKEHPIQFQATCHFQNNSVTSTWKNSKQEAKTESAKLMLEISLK